MAKQDTTENPADQHRPQYVTSRIRYFDGEFLDTQDFVDEQNYHVDRQVRHQEHLHAPGIMEGLEVTKYNKNQVAVSPGRALDASGNQILLTDAPEDPGSENFVDNAYNVTIPSKDGNYIVYLKFDETADDADQNGRDTRYTQKPSQLLNIQTPDEQLPDGAVLLARVRVSNKAIDDIDTDCIEAGSDGRTQKYAGVRLPGPSSSGDALIRVENLSKNSSDCYPSDDGYKAPNYKVTLAASSGFEVMSGLTADTITSTGQLTASSGLKVSAGGSNVTGGLTADKVTSSGELTASNGLTVSAKGANVTGGLTADTVTSSGALTASNGLTVSAKGANVTGGLTADKVTSSGELTANNGLTVSAGGADVTGGLTADTITSSGELKASNGLTVSAGGATVAGDLTATQYTFPSDSTPGDNPPRDLCAPTATEPSR